MTPASAQGYILNAPGELPEKRRPAVIICPGGGYEHLSAREAESIAMQYVSMGYHAFILKYSCSPAVFPGALMELAMLVSVIRTHADEWLVDINKVIVSGFSAGGHLAGSLGVFWNRDFLYAPLGCTPEEIRPNGMILAYPVITSGKHCHPGSIEHLLGDDAHDPDRRSLISLEHQAGEHTPPTFIWHTAADQSVPADNSLLLVDALVRHGVPVEFHLFPVGRHGLALATEETSGGKDCYIEPQCQSWISLVKTWLEYL